MNKYHCYYLNDFRDDYPAMAKEDPDGDWYRVEDVEDMTARLLADKNARIAELEEALKQREEQLRMALDRLRSDH